MKNIFFKLKNKDTKVLLGNFLSLSALQVVGMILPLITLPYVLRIIGLYHYGTIAIAMSLVGYFTSITDFSFMITATRDVAVFQHSRKKLDIIYSQVMMVKTIFLIFSFSIIGAVIFLYPPFFEERLIFFLCASSLIGNVLFPQWFFQGVEKMKFISFIKISIQILFALAIFIFIREEQDYWIYPLLISGGVIISGVIGQIILIKKFKLSFIWLPYKKIKKTIFTNFPLFTNQFLPTLYNNTSTFLLGFFVVPHLVGIYAAIRKIIDIAGIILQTFSKVFFPFINKRKNMFKHYKKLILLLTVFGVALILLSNQVIFWYLDIQHDSAFLVLLYLSLSIVGISLYDIYGLNFLVIRREDKLVMRNTILTSAIGFTLAFPLIYFLGIIGAALNLLTARLIMGLGIYWKFIQFKNA